MDPYSLILIYTFYWLRYSILWAMGQAMDMAWVRNDEIFYKKRRAFYGSVKYPLEYLIGEQSNIDLRQLD